MFNLLYMVSKHKYEFIVWMKNSVDPDALKPAGLDLHCFLMTLRLKKRIVSFLLYDSVYMDNWEKYEIH